MGCSVEITEMVGTKMRIKKKRFLKVVFCSTFGPKLKIKTRTAKYRTTKYRKNR
jgi:hypothetical protein